MRPSLFIEIIAKFFSGVIGRITEKFNDKNQEEVLLHKTMLDEEYSVDLQWGSTSINHSVVAADVVALDSSLPLKKRDKVSNASGELPKIGAKMSLKESDIQKINTMMAKGVDTATIVAKLFEDDAKLIRGVDIRNEINFLEALSTGVTLVEDEDMEETGIRVNFGYKDENKLVTTAAWGTADATPVDDLTELFDKAHEAKDSIGHVWISKAYFDKLRKSEQGKVLVADFEGTIYTNANKLATPSRARLQAALEDEFSAKFHIIDSVHRVEKKDGSIENVRPWAEANIIGTPSDKVGRLVYGTLAEEAHPVEGVKYEKAGSFILVSKYSETDPLREYTCVQALCLPVIDGADSFYMLQADQTAA